MYGKSKKHIIKFIKSLFTIGLFLQDLKLILDTSVVIQFITRLSTLDTHIYYACLKLMTSIVLILK